MGVEKIIRSFKFLSDARQSEGDEIAALFAYVFGQVISIKDSNYYEFGSDNRQDILKRKTPHFPLTNRNNLHRALISVNG